MKPEYDEPEWRAPNFMAAHDWHNYINEGLRVLWSTFTREQKKAIYENAEDCANSEECD